MPSSLFWSSLTHPSSKPSQEREAESKDESSQSNPVSDPTTVADFISERPTPSFVVMAQRPLPAPEPILTPQFCINTTALQDFLRLSRSAVDDSISTHLNAMITPARPSLFSKTPTQPEPPPRGNRRNIPGETCVRFQRDVLFPSWKSRDKVLRYCSSIASAPDASVTSLERETVEIGHRDFWGNPQPTNERLDPYSARDYGYNRGTGMQQVRSVLANEQGTEKIVRSRSWGVLGERCLGEIERREAAGLAGVEQDAWRGEYEKWKVEEGT